MIRLPRKNSKIDYKKFKKVVELSEVKENDTILDLGCSRCQIRKFLPKNVKYYGVDLRGDNKTVFPHDLDKGLPKQLKKMKFDAIFILDVLEHLENFKQLIKECKNILNDKGRIIVVVPNNLRLSVNEGEWVSNKPHIHGFNIIHLINLAKLCGMKLTKSAGIVFTLPILKWTFATDNLKWSDKLIVVFEKDQKTIGKASLKTLSKLRNYNYLQKTWRPINFNNIYKTYGFFTATLKK